MCFIINLKFEIMSLKKYAIVNDVDYPGQNMVTEIIEGKHYYMSRAYDSYKKEYDGMTFKSPTYLEEFGFDIKELEHQVDFELVRPSKAKYSDGEPRFWQGGQKFSLPKVYL